MLIWWCVDKEMSCYKYVNDMTMCWYDDELSNDVWLSSDIKLCIVESLLSVHAFMDSLIWRWGN